MLFQPPRGSLLGDSRTMLAFRCKLSSSMLLKFRFCDDLVIGRLLDKFRVIGHKRMVGRRVGDARKGVSLGRGFVALLLEEV